MTKLDTTINTIYGDPIKVTVKEEKRDMTLRFALVESLMNPATEKKGITGTEKIERYELALDINGGLPVPLSPEKVKLLKEAVNMTYPSLVAAQVWKLLDAPTKAPAKAK